MQFLLRFHRFRRLLNSATAALSSRIDAHTLAGPLGRSACLLSPKMLSARHQRHPPRCQTTLRTPAAAADCQFIRAAVWHHSGISITDQLVQYDA